MINVWLNIRLMYVSVNCVLLAVIRVYFKCLRSLRYRLLQDSLRFLKYFRDLISCPPNTVRQWANLHKKIVLFMKQYRKSQREFTCM